MCNFEAEAHWNVEVLPSFTLQKGLFLLSDFTQNSAVQSCCMEKS